MATISGKDGSVSAGGSDVAEVTAWSLTTKARNPSYASSATGGWRTRRSGVRDAMGVVHFKLDFADPATDLLEEGTAVSLQLNLDATRAFVVPAIIDEIAWEVDVDDGDVIGGRAEFSATGPVTKPTFS